MPTPDHLASLPECERSQLEALLLEYDRQWAADRLARFADRLPCDNPAHYRIALVELIKIDLDRQWQAGNTRHVEDYLQQFPILGSDRQLCLELIRSEQEARRLHAVAAPAAELATRFPDLQQAVAQSTGAPATAEPARHDTRVPTDTREHPTGGQPAGSRRTAIEPLPEQFGRYRILKRLGAGAMGAVYLAHDGELDRPVALKTPSFCGENTEEIEQRFLREARAAANLNHRNICPVYDAGTIDGVKYLTMAFIAGTPLSARIGEGSRMSARTAVSIARKLALALHYAHRQGVIHRDLKPANIMVDQTGEPVIMDFGLARRIDKPDDVRMTRTGALMGTPAYMAPEQISDNRQASGPASDIYSLGVILYELLTGELPFSGPIPVVIAQILNNDSAPPSSVRPELDAGLDAICLRMMARRPDRRYGSMREVAEALEEYLRTATGKRTDVADHDRGAAAALATGTSHSADLAGTPRRVITVADDSRRPGSAWIVAGVVVALLALLLVASVVFVRTGSGWVRIDVNDPDLRVAINDRELTVTDLQQPRKLPSAIHRLSVRLGQATIPLGRTFEVKTARHDGEYRLVAKLDGAELVGDRFEIQRGDRRTLSIALVPGEAAGQSQPLPTPGTLDAGSFEPSNAAAEPERADDPPYVLYLAAAAVMAAILLAVIGMVLNAARWSSQPASAAPPLTERFEP